MRLTRIHASELHREWWGMGNLCLTAPGADICYNMSYLASMKDREMLESLGVMEFLRQLEDATYGHWLRIYAR